MFTQDINQDEMKYSDFEKHIGNELGDAQEEVNMNELLLALNLDNITLDRKGRPFPLWIMIPVLLLGSFATFLAMDGNSAFNLNQLAENREIQSKDDLTKPNFENTAGITDAYQNANTEILNKKAIEIGDKKHLIITADVISDQNEVRSNNNKSRLEKSDISNLQINKEAHANSPSGSHSIQIEKKPARILPRKEGDFSNLAKLGTSTMVSSNSSERSKGETIENGRSYYKSSINNEAQSNSRENLSLSSIAMRSIDVADIDDKGDNIFSRMKINCPSFDNAHWRLALIPEIGIFAPYKTLENKKIENLQAFEEREKLEKTLEGINLGLYSMLVRDGLPFYMKAGISYSRISERMDLEYNYTKLDTTIGIISQTVSANGDSITTIKGPIISEIKLTGKNRQHNYIHLFDLPVSVGYSTYLGGFDIGIESGVKINLMTRATGNLLTSKSGFTNLSLNEMYKKRIGLSYFGGFMIGRNFGRFGDLYLAQRVTYYPTDFSNDNNNVSQKYVTMGINIGYVYKLK